jgi:hypothetical protein
LSFGPAAPEIAESPVVLIWGNPNWDLLQEYRRHRQDQHDGALERAGLSRRAIASRSERSRRSSETSVSKPFRMCRGGHQRYRAAVRKRIRPAPAALIENRQPAK